MKNQIVMAAAALGLVAGLCTPALADRDDRWERDDRDARVERRHYGERWQRHQRREWRRDLRTRRWLRQRYYPGGRWHYRPWRPLPRHRYRPHYLGWGPGYLGGAVLGSAITYRIVHELDDCRDCVTLRDGERRHAVQSCYRIELLPDGRERRVELPLADCL